MLTHGTHSLYLKYSTGDCFVCLSRWLQESRSVAVMMLTVVTVPGSQTNLLLTPHFAAPRRRPSGWLTPPCPVSRSVTCHVAAARHIVTRTHAAVSHALVGPFIFRSAAPPLCQAENKLYLKWIKYNGTRAVTRAGLKTSPMLRSPYSLYVGQWAVGLFWNLQPSSCLNGHLKASFINASYLPRQRSPQLDVEGKVGAEIRLL